VSKDLGREREGGRERLREREGGRGGGDFGSLETESRFKLSSAKDQLDKLASRSSFKSRAAHTLIPVA